MQKIRTIYFPLFCFITLFSIFFSCGDKNEFKIEGKLTNVKDSILLFTSELPNDSLTVDTILVNKEGTFTFRGKADSLTMCFLNFESQQVPLRVFVDKGWDIKIEGNAENTDLIEVKGGEVNDDVTAFKRSARQLLDSRARLVTKIRNNGGNSNDAALQTELKNTELELMNRSKEYIKANPTKIFSSVLISRFFKKEISPDVLDEQLALLQAPAANYYLTKNMEAYSQYIRKSMEGTIAPNFFLPDLSGVNQNLYQYRGKNIVLCFMSSTCRYCEEDIPYLKKAYKQVKAIDKNIVFVLVYANPTSDPIKEEVEALAKEMKILVDKKQWAGEPFSLYNVTSIPYYILISKDGKISERGIALTTLSEKISNILKEESDK